MVIEWGGLTGTIKGETCSGELILDVNQNPFWHACVMPESGSQVSKIFEEGKLEQAYEWCVTEIKEHERLRRTNS